MTDLPIGEIVLCALISSICEDSVFALISRDGCYDLLPARGTYSPTHTRACERVKNSTIRRIEENPELLAWHVENGLTRPDFINSIRYARNSSVDTLTTREKRKSRTRRRIFPDRLLNPGIRILSSRPKVASHRPKVAEQSSPRFKFVIQSDARFSRASSVKLFWDNRMRSVSTCVYVYSCAFTSNLKQADGRREELFVRKRKKSLFM